MGISIYSSCTLWDRRKVFYGLQYGNELYYNSIINRHNSPFAYILLLTNYCFTDWGLKKSSFIWQGSKFECHFFLFFSAQTLATDSQWPLMVLNKAGHIHCPKPEHSSMASLSSKSFHILFHRLCLPRTWFTVMFSFRDQYSIPAPCVPLKVYP